ncbi:hypothetical protein [Emticicia sp. 17c]|uniref:hypothetical protein n=1 Tax=Emticicia sp. 17c TaxID=3127704 RepID=UPI00301C6397
MIATAERNQKTNNTITNKNNYINHKETKQQWQSMSLLPHYCAVTTRLAQHMAKGIAVTLDLKQNKAHSSKASTSKQNEQDPPLIRPWLGDVTLDMTTSPSEDFK